MSTTPATAPTTARTIDDEFLDLICSDTDLLAVEFDAIIAEEWPQPPTARPARGASGRPGSSRPRPRPTAVDGRVARAPQPGVGRQARQRSPPRCDQGEPSDEKATGR
jgi:hypothetical protein